MAEFSIDLNKFLEHVDKNVNEVVRLCVIEVGEGLVSRTPVGNPTLWKSPAPPGYAGGRARANWQYGTSRPGGTVNSIDPSGGATTSKIKSSISKKAAGKVHYIQNNLPYIRVLEDGNHSSQCPNGMVGVVAAEWGSIVSSAARQVYP